MGPERAGQGSTYSVQDAIDATGFGRYQKVLCSIIGLVYITDAMEMMILSFLAPAVRCERWGISPTQESLLTTVVRPARCCPPAGGRWDRLLTDPPARRRGRRAAPGVLGHDGWGVPVGGGRRPAGTQVYRVRHELLDRPLWNGERAGPDVWAPPRRSLRRRVRPRRRACGVQVRRRRRCARPLKCARTVVLTATRTARPACSYFTEFLPSDVRGKFGVWVQFLWTIGTLVEALLGWTLLQTAGWRWLLFASALPVFLLLPFFSRMPESPRFLALHGRTEEARKLLADVAASNGKELPPGQLRESAPSGLPTREALRQLASDTYRRNTLLLYVLWLANAFVYCASRG